MFRRRYELDRAVFSIKFNAFSWFVILLSNLPIMNYARFWATSENPG